MTAFGRHGCWPATERPTCLVMLQALMQGSDWKDTRLLGRLEVLENLDAQSRVLKGTVSPNGAAHTVRLIKLLSFALVQHCMSMICARRAQLS